MFLRDTNKPASQTFQSTPSREGEHFLLLDPEGRWHAREIVRRTGCALAAVHRELKGLAGAGIIVAVQEGSRTHYQANLSCPFFPELSGLMRKTGGLAAAFRRALAPRSKENALAFIYGSQATGTATARSGVDLLMVGDVDDMLVQRAVSKAEDDLGRAVNYTLLSRREFGRRRGQKGGFLARVLAGDKIGLFGEMDGPR